MSPELSKETDAAPPLPERPWWKSPGPAWHALTAWIAGHRLAAVAAALAALLVLSLPVAIRLTLARRPARVKRIALAEVLAALDKQAYRDAQALAQRLQSQAGVTPEEQAGAFYVEGCIAAHDADLLWQGEPSEQYLVAAGYLQEAAAFGFPSGRTAYATLLCGKTLFRAGKFLACRQPLRRALPLNPELAPEIHHLLGSSYLRDADPKPGEALTENSAALAQRDLSLELKTRLLFQRAEILVALGRYVECNETLRSLAPHLQQGAEAMLLRGQALMAEARNLKVASARPDDGKRAAEKYQQAVKDLRLAQSGDTAAGQITRKAVYLIGVCFLETGDRRAAGNQFDRAFKLFAGTPEAAAAALQRAELARQQGHFDQAMVHYHQTVDAVGNVDRYLNPWLRLDDLRTRLIAAYQQFLDAQNFGLCLEMARLVRPLFPRERSIELTAESYRAWGHSLLEQAGHGSMAKADAIRREGRAQLRQAANTYRELAAVIVSQRRYPDELWNAVQAYLDGHDYRDAAATLKEYLRSEPHRRHAEALVSLGECMLAMEQYDEAVKVFNDCIVFHPQDAAAFRARLLASRANAEKGDLKQAETLLRENLQGELLTPESTEWRESLFDLGRLLYNAHRYEDAAARLEEAVARYPASPRTLESQYLTADSFRKIALAIEASLSQILVENTRTARAKQIRQSQELALDRFQKIQAALSQQQELSELTAMQKAILRNSQFAAGGLLFDLGRYEESIRAYTTAANRARNTPEALEAYAQIAAAYRRLGKPLEARLVIEQAKSMLSHVKNESAFTQSTNYNRKEWIDRLSRLGAL
jgi:tetratricopeptide (TPR) repeat protein